MSSTARPTSVLRAASTLALAVLVSCVHAPSKHATADARCVHDGDCAQSYALCEGGDVNACLTLGMLYATTSGGAFHRPELGERYLLRACKLAVLSCDELVSVADERAVCRDDHVTRTRLIQAACDAGYPPACVQIAYALVDGIDVPRNVDRAAQLFAWACDVGDAFPEFVLTNDEGQSVPHRDPMSAQPEACIASETMTKLALTTLPPAKTSPEDALRLDLARREKFRGKWQFTPNPFTMKQLAHWRATDARTFAEAPEQRAANALAARKVHGGIAPCGPILDAQ